MWGGDSVFMEILGELISGCTNVKRKRSIGSGSARRWNVGALTPAGASGGCPCGRLGGRGRAKRCPCGSLGVRGRAEALPFAGALGFGGERKRCSCGNLGVRGRAKHCSCGSLGVRGRAQAMPPMGCRGEAPALKAPSPPVGGEGVGGVGGKLCVMPVQRTG